MKVLSSYRCVAGLVILLVLLAGFVPAASPVSAAPRAQSAEVFFILQTPAYKIQETSTGYARLAIDGFDQAGLPGQPALPYHVYTIALPPDASLENLALEIVSTQEEILPGSYNLEPARAPQVKSEPGQPASSVISQDLPTGLATLLPPGQLRRWQFARVWFSPARYDPATGSLAVVTRAELRITYTPRVLPAAEILSDGVMDDVAADLFLNYDQAQSWYPQAGTVSAQAVYNYVIITTEAIRAASTRLDDFITHKQNMGYSVLVVTENDYGSLSGPTPNGRAENIRKWLQDNYVAMSIQYVLLIGNPDPDDPDQSDAVGDVPMKMCYPTTYSEYTQSPSDYYYADLTGNWNRDGDTHYCEYAGDTTTAGGVDMAAEVFVGRIPVYSTDLTDLDSILNKTISYESDPDPSAWRRSALLPMSFVDSNTDDAYFAEQMKEEYLGPAGFTSWTMYQQGDGACQVNSSKTSNENLRGGYGVRNRWAASDYGLVVWSGHGSPTSVAIGYDGCWDGSLMTSGYVPALDNNHPSFVYASSCNNGYPEDPTNLGYSMLKNGAITTASASRVSWYVPGDYDFRNDSSVSGLGYEYSRRLVVANDEAGKALYGAKAATAAADQAWLMNKLDYNLYGDPSVKIITTPPGGNPMPSLSSLSPSTLLAGSGDFTLTVNGSNFLDSSVVRWNGEDLPTTFVNITRLTAEVGAARLASSGTAQVTVFNPAPVGGLSSSLAFTIQGEAGTCSPVSEIFLNVPDSGRNDRPGSTDNIDAYPLTTWVETGPEYAYTFTAPAAATYSAALSGLTQDLDLFLLDGSPGFCSAGSALSFNDISLTFTSTAPGQVFYLVVDGYGGSVGPYTLTLTCTSCPGQPRIDSLSPPLAYAGGPDFTLTVTGQHFVDGSVVYWDSQELVTQYHNAASLSALVPASLTASPTQVEITVLNPDSQVSPPITYLVQEDTSGQCQPRVEINGASMDTRRNDSYGSTDTMDEYAISSWSETGPEFAYLYVAEEDTSVSARLSKMSADLDLIVIAGDDSGICRAVNAVSVSDVETRFSAEAGRPYYIVVDGYAGAVGSYTLTVHDDVRIPANPADLKNNRPIFNWEDVPGATGYVLQIAYNDRFTSLFWSKTVTQSVFFPPGDLPRGRALYWRFYPKFGSTSGEKSEPWLLYTATPPSVPGLASPSSGALLRDFTPRLNWNNALVASGDSFDHYQAQVASNPYFLDPVLDVIVPDRYFSEFTPLEDLPSNTRYYWRVRAFDVMGEYSNWSSVRNFRTALSIPVLDTPSDGESVFSSSPTFTWSGGAGAASYTLQIALSPSFSSLTASATLPGYSYTYPRALRSGRLYYWRVRANGSNGPSFWSQPRTFYIP